MVIPLVIYSMDSININGIFKKGKKNMSIELFIEETKKLGLNLTEKQLSQLEKFYKLLISWNEKMNLTRITEKEEVYLKHFYGLDGITSSGFESNEEYTENEFKQYHKIIEACNKRNVEIIYLDEIKSDTLTINFENIDIELYDIKNTIYDIYNDSSSPYYNQKRFSENYNSIGIFIKINNNTIFLGGDVTCSKSDILELNGLSTYPLLTNTSSSSSNKTTDLVY